MLESRRMKKRIVIVAAIASGIVAALLTRFYLAGKDSEVRRMKEAFVQRYGEIDVLCFRRDVPAGAELTRKDIGEITVPKTGLRGQALTREDLATVIGRKSVIAHRQGEVVFWSDIEGGNPHESGLAADVKRTMRAISINASGAAAVSGMVRPNDHVDVIGTFVFPDETGKTSRDAMVTYTILQNVLVLATGRETAKGGAGRNGFGGQAREGYSTVTLEVTPREAEMLVFCEQMRGHLTLTLRNRNDTSAERELPQIDFQKIRSEIEDLNNLRQERVR